MAENTPIMMNDSLARQMAHDNAYDRSLGDVPPETSQGLQGGGTGEPEAGDTV